MRPMVPNPLNSGPPRFVGAIFGFVFFGIGLTVLGFLWLSPFGEFGSPPLFFRIFGSFIAIAFVAMGGGMATSMLFGKQSAFDRVAEMQASIRAAQTSKPIAPGSYVCPHCAAPLQDKANVSPSGDVKCAFCNSWFNVHGKQF